MREPPPPVLAPFGGEHTVELLRRHVVRVVPQLGENRGELRRKHVARIHRNHLPELHRRPPQMRQLVGNPRRIGRREQQVTHARTFATGEPPCAFGNDPARDTAGQTPENAQPGETATGDRASCAGFAAAVFAHITSFAGWNPLRKIWGWETAAQLMWVTVNR